MSGRRKRKGRAPDSAPQARVRAPFPWPRFNAADAAILSAAVAVFSWICYRNIWQPGLYGDEAWEAVAAARFAWGSPSNPAAHYEVTVFGRIIPMMLNAYVGPVKAWILAASFAVFGVTVPVLRATTGTIGLAGIVALYFLARAEFGRLAAAAAALLVASDLSFVLATRCDWGPVDFAFFARVTSILLFLTWRRNRGHPALLFLAALLLGLGLSFKFDFLGTVAAVTAAAVLFYGRGLRPRLAEALAAAAGFLIGSTPMILYNVVNRGATFRAGQDIARGFRHPPIWEAAAYRLRVLRDLLRGYIGVFFLGQTFQKDSLFGGSLSAKALLLLPFLLAVPFLLRRFSEWRRALAFLVAVFVFLFLSLAAVSFAGGPHHVISLYPFPQLLLAVGLAALWRAGEGLRGGLAWIPRGAAAAAFALLIVSNLALADTFHRRLASKGGARYWSESIYDLSASLQREHPDDVIELLDWGFEQPLILLARDRLRVHALHWRIQSDPEAEALLTRLLREPGRVFVGRPPEFAFDRKVYERFDAAVRNNPDLAVEETPFFQKDGRLSCTVLKFRPRS